MRHRYEKLRRRGQLLVRDRTTGLLWQQNGSPDLVSTLDKAKKRVQELNWNAFAGYTDWRLPTLEEAMSLMERTERNGDLYIDPIFDKRQRWIWTCDKVKRASRAWAIYFSNGTCYNGIDVYDSVCAVRS